MLSSDAALAAAAMSQAGDIGIDGKPANASKQMTIDSPMAPRFSSWSAEFDVSCFPIVRGEGSDAIAVTYRHEGLLAETCIRNHYA